MASYTHDLKARELTLGPLRFACSSLFWQRIRYSPRSLTGSRVPLFEHASAQETEEPYRKGHAFAVRLWPTHSGLVLGYWGEPQIADEVGEDEALYRLVGASDDTRSFKPVTAFFPPVWEDEAGNTSTLTPEEQEERSSKYATLAEELRDTHGIDLVSYLDD